MSTPTLDAMRETTVRGPSRNHTITDVRSIINVLLSVYNATGKAHAGREIENLSVLQQKVSLDR